MSILQDNFHLHIHIPGMDTLVAEVVKSNNKLDLVLTKQTQLMASFQQIKTEFDALKAAIAEERAQATAKLAELQASIDALTQNIAEGGSVEERDALLSDITSQVAEVKAIIPDPATEPETPTEPAPETPEA